MRLQVDEMEKAVDVAEQSMARFNLTPQVVAVRRKWVKDTRKKVWLRLHCFFMINQVSSMQVLLL